MMGNDRFTLSLTVYPEDTDFSGIVYHANYLKYMDRARVAWAEQRGINMASFLPLTLVVYKVEIEYLKPLRLSDHIVIESKIIESGRVSCVYQQVVYQQQQLTEPCCSAKVTVASVNQDLRLSRLPKSTWEKLVHG